MAFTVLDAFNIGQDVNVIIADDKGNQNNLSDFGHWLELSVEADTHLIDIRPASRSGIPIRQMIPQGFHGRVRFARVNGSIGRLWLQQMLNWYNLHQLSKFTMEIAILNRDGTVDEYACSGITFDKPSLLDARGDKEVEQSLEFFGANIIQANGPAAGSSPMPGAPLAPGPGGY